MIRYFSVSIKSCRTLAFGLSFVMIVLSLNGCYAIESKKSPTEIYQMALSGLSGVDNFKFRGRAEVYGTNGKRILEPINYEGNVIGHKQQTFKIASESGTALTYSERWNPLHQLELLRNLGKSIQINEQKSNDQQIVLEIKLNPGEGTKLLIQNLKSEMNGLQEGRYLVQNAAKLDVKKQKELQKELDSIYKNGVTKLQSLTQNMESNASYVLWVDRSSLIPTRVYSKTQTRFVDKGKARTEAVTTDAKFDGYQ
ncbi:hypothetical protein BVG16_11855 [Paenibacillus selenitireducens]|uniref:Lipoprotein n=1 Tax=Paenibacillus selenitireducens TaxID=1324314 RepID=A0A1T2XFE3_9BACL|nr:hypothetical protein [Paenibacillus selenitireducens]OPA78555.1 hypothetical protein BVG16_11855 [Paenibacillus selenitireducens]